MSSAKFVLGDGAFEASFVAGAAPANSGLGPLFLQCLVRRVPRR